jgi:hypothetical protein
MGLLLFGQLRHFRPPTGTGEVLLDSAANLLTGESVEVINIRGLAVVLNSWLEERLWPE